MKAEIIKSINISLDNEEYNGLGRAWRTLASLSSKIEDNFEIHEENNTFSIRTPKSSTKLFFELEDLNRAVDLLWRMEDYITMDCNHEAVIEEAE